LEPIITSSHRSTAKPSSQVVFSDMHKEMRLAQTSGQTGLPLLATMLDWVARAEAGGMDADDFAVLIHPLVS
jgi:hypothetical protein